MNQSNNQSINQPHNQPVSTSVKIQSSSIEWNVNYSFKLKTLEDCFSKTRNSKKLEFEYCCVIWFHYGKVQSFDSWNWNYFQDSSFILSWGFVVYFEMRIRRLFWVEDSSFILSWGFVVYSELRISIFFSFIHQIQVWRTNDTTNSITWGWDGKARTARHQSEIVGVLGRDRAHRRPGATPITRKLVRGGAKCRRAREVTLVCVRHRHPVHIEIPVRRVVTVAPETRVLQTRVVIVRPRAPVTLQLHGGRQNHLIAIVLVRHDAHGVCADLDKVRECQGPGAGV